MVGSPFQGSVKFKTKTGGMGDNSFPRFTHQILHTRHSDGITAHLAYPTAELLCMGKYSMPSIQLIADTENLNG